MAAFGEGYRFHVTGLNHDDSGFPTTKPELVQAQEERLMNKVLLNRKKIEKYDYYKMDDAVKELRSKMKAVIVPEMNLGQMLIEVERCLGTHNGLKIAGVNRVDGEP